ncbi:AI-2E family transporter [Sabulicella rubraurantiaca]|uniref:AI-2E family transporter n=1 Tax=Sabulicella rubraurantiaca TaxID=2811429 RepID=UPI001A975B79|nr:AI-2E family transporter [Sabulicella rubraurantiaca]
MVIAALYLAQDVLVPLVLAGLLAFVLAPLARLGRRIGIPRGASVVLAALLGFLLLLGIGALIGHEGALIASEAPRYVGPLRQKLGVLSGLSESLRNAEAMLRGTASEPVPVVVDAEPARPTSTSLQLAGTVLGPVLAPLATAGLVALFTVFILLFSDDLRDRVIRLAGARDLPRTMAAMNDAADRLSRLFLAQVVLAAGFGVAVAAGLWLLGLPAALLWGLLVGLMRFVPFIGTPIAILPPVVLALAIEPGWELAISVLALILLGEVFMGQVAEPVVLGRRTGLSPISVILSASFWTLLWGPIGLLIATPLTVGLVVLGRHVPQLEFLDVMLGDRPALAAEETFYQRALEGDVDRLVVQAHAAMEPEDAKLLGFADSVALRALALAATDWSREILESDRLEKLRIATGTLIDELAESLQEEATLERPADWAAAGAVLCVPARGPLDDVAARFAALVLRRDGFGAVALGPGALDAANIGQLDPVRVRLVCLSVLEEGNSVSGVRTSLRRLARHLPEARVAVGIWNAAPESAMLTALRADGPADVIVTSLGEALAQVEAYSSRAATRAAEL